MQQGGRLKVCVDAGEPQDALTMGRAAAFERHIDMREAQPLCSRAGESIGPALAMAAQVHQGAQAEPALGRGQPRWGWVVRPV